MKPQLFYIAILFSTLSFSQTQLTKEKLWKLLTTSYDTTGNDFDIDFASWITENLDSAFYKSDTVSFYRNPDFRFCEDSTPVCWTLEWNFYLNPFTQTNSYTTRTLLTDNDLSFGAILSNGVDNEVSLKVLIQEKKDNLILSIKTHSDWQSFQLIEINTWSNSNDPTFTVTELKLLKLKKDG